jgi:hypothetical protein
MWKNNSKKYHTTLVSSKYSITSHLAQNGTFLPKSMKEWESLQDWVKRQSTFSLNLSLKEEGSEWISFHKKAIRNIQPDISDSRYYRPKVPLHCP